MRYSNVFVCFFIENRSHQLSTWWDNVRWVIQNRYSSVKGVGVSRSCARTHLYYLFSCFVIIFVLWCLAFICRNLTLLLLKKDVFVRSNSFSPTRPISVFMKYGFFYLKLILQTKVSQMLLILTK